MSSVRLITSAQARLMRCLRLSQFVTQAGEVPILVAKSLRRIFRTLKMSRIVSTKSFSINCIAHSLRVIHIAN